MSRNRIQAGSRFAGQSYQNFTKNSGLLFKMQKGIFNPSLFLGGGFLLVAKSPKRPFSCKLRGFFSLLFPQKPFLQNPSFLLLGLLLLLLTLIFLLRLIPLLLLFLLICLLCLLLILIHHLLLLIILQFLCLRFQNFIFAFYFASSTSFERTFLFFCLLCLSSVPFVS